MARDLGVQRVPVSGREKHEADFEDAIACYQLKQRGAFPTWLWGWLSGICATAKPKGKAGVLVLSRPGRPRSEAVVILNWAAWRDLHGTPEQAEDELSR